MKKNILTIFFLGFTCAIFSQSHVDALRYSQHTIGGTARSVAMAGAFGALGGDFSTLSTNPAGLGVYRRSEFTFTPEFYSSNTTSRYFGDEVKEGKFNVNLSNLGYVANFKTNNGILKAVNFGVGYNRIANFHKNTIINGINEKSSLGDYMASQVNGTYDAQNDLFTFSSFNTELFKDAEIILYDSVGNSFVLNDYDNTGYIDEYGFIPTEQRKIMNETGRINEWTISLGFNLDDILYIGGTIGIQPVRYKMENTWKEYDGYYEPHPQYFEYNESLEVNGTGYTGKIGVIVRPIHALRLGAAFHLPVTYKLTEQYKTNIWSRYINQTYYPIDSEGNDIDYLESKYTVVSPFKAIGSVAAVFGKFLVLSGDLEYIDYSSMRMSSDEIPFDDENESIRKIYKDAVNIKLGSEFRINKIYFRGGAGFYGSPFAELEENQDAFRISYSAGLGIRDKSFFFDMAYQYVNYDERTILYDAGFDAPAANIDTKSHRIMTTVGFRF